MLHSRFVLMLEVKSLTVRQEEMNEQGKIQYIMVCKREIILLNIT